MRITTQTCTTIAFMPHMQRITWSGELRSTAARCREYPASMAAFGCPSTSPNACSDLTQLGLRVIVAPTDVAPAEIAHPVLFSVEAGCRRPWPPPVIAEGGWKAGQEGRNRQDAPPGRAPSGRSRRPWLPVRCGRKIRKRRAEMQLAAAETALGSAITAEGKGAGAGVPAKAQARARELPSCRRNGTPQKAELQPEARCRDDCTKEAAAARRDRGGARRQPRAAASGERRELEPVSVLISPQDANDFYGPAGL